MNIFRNTPFSRPIPLVCLGFALCCSNARSASFTTGDVFAAVGNSQVKVFTPSGTLITTLSDGSNATFTTGMVFDGSGNLYVTNFSAGNISKFDSSGALVSSSFMSGGVPAPESILVNKAGNFLVGGPSTPVINQYAPTGGTPTVNYSVMGGNGTGGTDWTDLAADQKTILYDGEGTEILSYNLATKTQNTPFATGLPGNRAFEFRIIPSGSFAGDVLAADSQNAILIDGSGHVIKTYTLPGNSGGDFALNLDPDGTDFWTGDSLSGNIWEVNISSGAIDEQFNSGNPGTLFGLVVNGQITAGGPPPTIPEPSTISLLVCGAAALAVRVCRPLRLSRIR